jgi:hypothetical protein
VTGESLNGSPDSQSISASVYDAAVDKHLNWKRQRRYSEVGERLLEGLPSVARGPISAARPLVHRYSGNFEDCNANCTVQQNFHDQSLAIMPRISVGVSVRHFLRPARGLVFQTGGDPPFGFLEAQHGSEYAP